MLVCMKVLSLLLALLEKLGKKICGCMTTASGSEVALAYCDTKDVYRNWRDGFTIRPLSVSSQFYRSAHGHGCCSHSS